MHAPPPFQVLVTFVVSLFPLAVYCLILAGINRRDRPLVVRGAWDFIGVLAALSGILLWTGPVLLRNLMTRSFVENVAQDSPQPIDEFWSRWWLIWAAYYVLVVAGATLLLILRGSVTAIYNLDVEQLPTVLLRTVQHLGFDVARNPQQQILIAPAKSLTPADRGANGNAHGDAAHGDAAHGDAAHGEATGPQPFSAAIDIDVLPSMCHATLHWYTDDNKLRSEIELELSKQLSGSRPADNLAALWFLTASTMLFGAIIVGAAFYIIASLQRF